MRLIAQLLKSNAVAVNNCDFNSLLTYLPMYSQLSRVLKMDSEDVVDVFGTKCKSISILIARNG